MRKIAIIGTTAWGTTLGVILARKGLEVWLWARTEEEATKLNDDGEHALRLPGIPFPDTLRATGSLAGVVRGAELVILAVPAQTMRSNVRRVRDALEGPELILSVAKGLELGSTRRMSQVIAEELPGIQGSLCVLSGPNLSREIAQGLPAATVVASHAPGPARRVQEILASAVFRVYTNTDVVGVELGGALKNIIALGAGMADGLGYGNNAKATLMTRGLAEITRLGVAAGANPLTFAGLAGLGDLVTTCASPLSRNRYVGVELARGRSLKEITASMTSVAEGVDTTVAALSLARGLGVEMPIAQQVHRVLFEGLDVRQAVAELMGRELKHELSGIWP